MMLEVALVIVDFHRQLSSSIGRRIESISAPRGNAAKGFNTSKSTYPKS